MFVFIFKGFIVRYEDGECGLIISILGLLVLRVFLYFEYWCVVIDIVRRFFFVI